MFCAGEDVNTAAETSTTATTEVGAQQTAPSAETLNTDTGGEHETHVPYERFKQVNEKLRQLEAQAGKYLQNTDLYSTYEQFDQILMSNPELAERVKSALIGQAQGQEIPQQIQSQLQSGDPLAQNLAIQFYVNEFQRMAQAEGIPGELVNDYGEFTKQELLKINPNPIGNFNVNSLQIAFNKAKERMNRITNFDRSSYVKAKQGDHVPASPSATGSAPAQNVQLTNQNDRASYLANALKSAT